jgi:hypothetical protein
MAAEVRCLASARRSRQLAATRREFSTTHPTLSKIMELDRRLSDLESRAHHLRGSRGYRQRDQAFVEAVRNVQREITGLQAKRAALCGVKAVRRVK